MNLWDGYHFSTGQYTWTLLRGQLIESHGWFCFLSNCLFNWCQLSSLGQLIWQNDRLSLCLLFSKTNVKLFLKVT